MKDFEARIDVDGPGVESYRVRVKVPYAYCDGLTRVTVFCNPAWADNGIGPWRCSVNSSNHGPFATRKAASEAALAMLREQAETLLSITLKDLMPDAIDEPAPAATGV